MALYGTVEVKDLGNHILVEDVHFDYYMFKKVDNWVLKPKKMRGGFNIPREVYETLWVQGYKIL